jgi:hypothetical protein
MALTVTEANAVNTLLAWFVKENRSETDARAAATLLADHAYARIAAGLRGSDVTTSWVIPEVPV